jgi:hypothetical protein
MIISRGAAIGLDWASTLAELKQLDWDARLAEVTDPAVGSAYPKYYTQPFHAYKQVRTAATHARSSRGPQDTHRPQAPSVLLLPLLLHTGQPVLGRRARVCAVVAVCARACDGP